MSTEAKLNRKKDKRLALIEQADSLMKKHNLRVVHVRGYNWDMMSATAKGGATLVYHRDKSRDRIIRVSVALVNDKDSYCKLTGRLIAAMQYDTGNHIAVRVPKNKHPVVFLKQMFSEMVAPYVS